MAENWDLNGFNHEQLRFCHEELGFCDIEAMIVMEWDYNEGV